MSIIISQDGEAFANAGQVSGAFIDRASIHFSICVLVLGNELHMASYTTEKSVKMAFQEFMEHFYLGCPMEEFQFPPDASKDEGTQEGNKEQMDGSKASSWQRKALEVL